MMRTLAATMIIALGFAVAYADRPQHKPPQAAFDACTKSKKGDACTFKGRNDHEMKGTCETPREAAGSALVCRPQRPENKGSGSGSGSGSGK